MLQERQHNNINPYINDMVAEVTDIVLQMKTTWHKKYRF